MPFEAFRSNEVEGSWLQSSMRSFRIVRRSEGIWRRSYITRIRFLLRRMVNSACSEKIRRIKNGTTVCSARTLYGGGARRLIWFADKNKNRGTKAREGGSFDPLEFIRWTFASNARARLSTARWNWRQTFPSCPRKRSWIPSSFKSKKGMANGWMECHFSSRYTFSFESLRISIFNRILISRVKDVLLIALSCVLASCNFN